MDYEKAYKAVLQTATQWIKDGCTDKEKICLECVFPELRESEDESIRKGMIRFLKSEQAEGIFTYEARQSWIAYLERQKEQKDYRKLYDDIAKSDWFKKAYHGKSLGVEDEQKEQKPLITGNDFGWIDELKHDLKHPEELDQKVDDVLKQRKGIRTLEWSEDNIKELTEFEAAMLHIGTSFFGGSAGLSPNNTNEVKKQAMLLLELVPKQEWSEEDEIIFNTTLTHLLSYAYPNNPIYREEAEKCVAWLKSLRPQPHWKPSKEQMEALERTIRLANFGLEEDRRKALKSLCEHLKKLT